MANETRNESSNTTILKGLCVALPVMTLAAAHWFPWHKMLGRDLHRLEAYAIGTASIVGTASTAIALSNGDKDDHVKMLNLAAASAGGITVLAHATDFLLKTMAKVTNLEAQIQAIKTHGDLR